MTDQADALAFCGGCEAGWVLAWRQGTLVHINVEQHAGYTACARLSAHFAEEIAALTIERDKIEERLSVAVDNLTAENERLKGTLADWVTTYERWTVKNSADAFHPELRPHLEQLEMENERLKGKCEDIERAYENLRRRFVQSEQDLAHVDADTRHTIAQLHQAEATLERVREESAIWESTANSYSDTLDALTAENERLKGELQMRESNVAYQQRRAEQAEGDYKETREELQRVLGLLINQDDRVEQAEAALARVREGLTKEKIAEAVIGTFTATTGTYGPVVTRDQAHHAHRLVDAILALLAPEGN